MTTTLGKPIEDLEWLRTFAARLGGTDGDDFAQDAMLGAFVRPPPDVSTPRAWLATVVRNRMNMTRRSAGARRARETEFVALHEQAETTDATVHRLAVLHVLVDRLEALPEDARKIVVARYFDGRNATEIGDALGLAPSSVRSILRRSLQRLRGELDERFGGERIAWSAAVAFPGTPVAVTSAGLGAPTALLSLAKAVVAALAIVGVAALGWLAMRTPPEPAKVVPVAAQWDQS